MIKMLCFHLCPFVGWLNFVTAVGNVEAMRVSGDRSEEENMQMRNKKKQSFFEIGRSRSAREALRLVTRTTVHEP